MTSKVQRDPDRVAARRAREDANLFGRLAFVHSSARKQAQNLLRDGGGGISIVEWRTLWDLHEAGPMTISDLASTQRTDHSLLSRALPDMRRKGLVSMERAEEDGRQTIVTITPMGRTAYDRASPVMTRRRAALHEAFSEDEITTFVQFLDRLEAFASQPTDGIVNKELAQ